MQTLSWMVWPAIVLVPLVFTSGQLYEYFPESWFDRNPVDFWHSKSWPSPFGLSLGLLSVVVGQIFVLTYFICRKLGFLGETKSIQSEGARNYKLSEGLITHLAQPEGFVMLGGYLIFSWMFGLMPQSYYSFSGGINWVHVIMQLLLTDALQYSMHMLEHKLSPWIYQKSHKPHHRFTNPRLFDAFNGSPTDTFLMILIPLMITARLVNANVWSYMTFGSLFANWLTLIHAEYSHPWEAAFRAIGFGTAGDHHVHHKLFTSNYGHLFMYWDYIFGTYKNPRLVQAFNVGA